MCVSDLVTDSATTLALQRKPALGWDKNDHVSIACKADNLVNDRSKGFVDRQKFDEADDTKKQNRHEKQNVSLARLHQGRRQSCGVIDHLQAHQVFANATTLEWIVADKQQQNHDQFVREKLHRHNHANHDQHGAEHHAHGESDDDIRHQSYSATLCIDNLGRVDVEICLSATAGRRATCRSGSTGSVAIFVVIVFVRRFAPAFFVSMGSVWLARSA